MPVSSSVADLDFIIIKNLWQGPKEPQKKKKKKTSNIDIFETLPARATSPPTSTFRSTDRKLFTSMTSPFMQMSWLGSFNLRGAKVTGSE